MKSTPYCIFDNFRLPDTGHWISRNYSRMNFESWFCCCLHWPWRNPSNFRIIARWLAGHLASKLICLCCCCRRRSSNDSFMIRYTCLLLLLLRKQCISKAGLMIVGGATDFPDLHLPNKNLKSHFCLANCCKSVSENFEDLINSCTIWKCQPWPWNFGWEPKMPKYPLQSAPNLATSLQKLGCKIMSTNFTLNEGRRRSQPLLLLQGCQIAKIATKARKWSSKEGVCLAMLNML